jgi:hypothetical protein
VNYHCDPSHWPNTFPRKSYQWSVVGSEVRLFETESVKQVWVHYFKTATLIYQHSFDIQISNFQFDHQWVVVRSLDIPQIFIKEENLLLTVWEVGSWFFRDNRSFNHLKDFPKMLSFFQIRPQPIVWLPTWLRCVDHLDNPNWELDVVGDRWPFMVVLLLAIS